MKTNVHFTICILLFTLFSACQNPPVKDVAVKEISPTPSQELEIILSFVSGEVVSGKKLSSGDKISKGATLQTGEKSFADIQPLYPGIVSTLRLEQKTEISSEERSFQNKKEILLFLKQGDASINTKSIDSSKNLFIITPTLHISLSSNSKLGLKVAPDGTTNLEVYEGEISFRLVLKEEITGFPLDLEKNESIAKFISENLANAGSKLDMGGKVTITPKQRDDFVKKRKR